MGSATVNATTTGTYNVTNALNTANVIVEVYNSSGALQIPSSTGAITSITVTATQISIGVGTTGTYTVLYAN